MNTNPLFAAARLTDDELLAHVKHLTRREHKTTACLVAHLAELDARRLYLAEGYSSLFSYCVAALHLSEHAAYHRIEAARAARRYPLIIERLAEGAVHLTAVGLLAPHLTAANHRTLLDEARHRTKRQVEEMVARVRPLPAAPTIMRRLPGAPDPVQGPPLAGTLQFSGSESGSRGTAPPDTAPTTGPTSTSPTPLRPALLTPLAPDLYKIQLTVGAETYGKLRQAQDLLRHQIPDGDPAEIVDRALTLLLEKLTRRKFARLTANAAPDEARGGSRPARPAVLAAATTAPALAETGAAAHPAERAPGAAVGPAGSSPHSTRHIPAAVRRAVWNRDEGRCAYRSPAGLRCPERGWLEFHHVEPYARGGASTELNIQLRCRAHNALEAEFYYRPVPPRDSRAGSVRDSRGNAHRNAAEATETSAASMYRARFRRAYFGRSGNSDYLLMTSRFVSTTPPDSNR